MFADIRFALRQIFRNRAVSLVAVLTLALGIGANTAIFSVIHAVMLEPLGYPESDRLMMVFETVPSGSNNSVSGGAYKDWAEHSRQFESLAVFEDIQRNLTGRGAPERLGGLAVSSEFLPTLGIRPTQGRGFLPGEDQPGGNARVVILTHELWSSRFGQRSDVLGQTFTLDQHDHTIIGVLPPQALFRDQARFLVPTVIDDDPDNWLRAGHWRNVVGRLRPGAQRADAEADLRRVKTLLAAEYPAFKEDWSVAVVPLQEVFAGPVRPILKVLLGTVALVLLIACANISNLLLAQGTSRAREMAIRASLGAHRWRIVRQVLVESLTLAALGCGAGLLVAEWGIELLAVKVSDSLPAMLRPQLDPGVLAFSIAVAGGCGLLFGILPALRASRHHLNQDLTSTGRSGQSGSQKRAQTLLVVSELALTLMLLVGAGLFLRSFLTLLETDPGFDPRQTVAFDLSFPEAKYPTAEDRLALLRNLETELGAIPGVEMVGTTSSLPLSRTGRTEFASRADQPPSTDYTVGCTFVSDEYFSAMGMTLLAGRGLAGGATVDGAPHEAVVDQGLAEHLFPGEDPLGQTLRFLRDEWRIVGVVAPVRHFVLDHDQQPMVYLPQTHAPEATSVVLRSASSPAGLIANVRETLRQIDPEQPIANLRTLEQSVDTALSERRMPMLLLGLFAVLALGLACVGVYGVMAFSISQRTRELGIRSALGAQRRDLHRLILRGGLRPTLAGVGLGLLGALVLARLVASQLYAVGPFDPRVFLGAVVVLVAMAGLSIDIPARRAAKAEPIRALRED